MKTANLLVLLGRENHLQLRNYSGNKLSMEKITKENKKKMWLFFISNHHTSFKVQWVLLSQL